MDDSATSAPRRPRTSAAEATQRYLGRGRVAAGVTVIAALLTGLVSGDAWFDLALIVAGSSLVVLGLLTMTGSMAARADVRRLAGIGETSLFALILAVGVDENAGYVIVVALLMLVLAGLRGVRPFRQALIAAVVAEAVRQAGRASLVGNVRLDEALLGLGVAAVLGAVVARLVALAHAAERSAIDSAIEARNALSQARTALRQRDQLHRIIAADIGQDRADIDRIAAAVADAFGLDSVSIILVDDEGRATVAASTDPAISNRDDIHPLPGGPFVEGPLARALAGVSTVATDDELARLSALVEPLGALSVHPLRRADGAAIGALACSLPAGRTFHPDELDTIGRFADQTSLAIEAARAVEREAELAGRYRDLDRLKTDFVAITSHELRTPLTMLIGAIQVLRDRGSHLSPEDREGLWDAVQRQGRRLGRLVDDLRTVSLVEAGTLTVTLEPTDVVQVVTDSIASLADVPTDLRVDRPVPKVMADQDRLDQIITNLVVNGVQHGQGTVHLHVLDEGDAVILRIWDDGPGIARDQRDAIFERFVRLGQADSHHRGTGLGLAIARDLVEAMQGSIRVADHRDGSRFEVRLPALP